MKTLKLTVILLSLAVAPLAMAADAPVQGHSTGGEVKVDPVVVGNKICPVSGEKVGEMGKVVTIEHEGKVYNLCCEMCKKDFNKDPQKYIDKINEEMKGQAQEK